MDCRISHMLRSAGANSACIPLPGSMLRESSAGAWRLYGLCLWHSGRREAGSAALVQALQLAPPPLPDEAPPQEHTAALCTLAGMQYHAAGAQQALQTLKESVPECWQDTQVSSLKSGGLVCALASHH